MIKIPTKEETETEGFITLPEDDYLLEIEEAEEKNQKKYQSEDMEDVLNVRFKVKGLRDDGKLVDDEGEDATGRKLFFTGRLESLGFQQDGTPSKTRQLLCFAMGSDINEGPELEASDLIGKKLYGQVIKKMNTKGVMTNRIVRFIPIKKEKKDDIPVVEDETSVEDLPF